MLVAAIVAAVYLAGCPAGAAAAITHDVIPLLIIPSSGASNGNLTLTAEGLALLDRISGPVALVGLTGPHRSGKSFLGNALTLASMAMCASKDTLAAVELEAAGGTAAAAADPADSQPLLPAKETFPVDHTVKPVTITVNVKVLTDASCSNVTLLLLGTWWRWW